MGGPRLAVLTSGGDAPGMNAAVRAVVRNSHFHGWEPMGVYQGFDGLITGSFAVMDAGSVGDIIQRGGTVLRSGRSDAFTTDEGFRQALQTLSEQQIQAVVVIGGNGSLRGALRLAQAGVSVIGVPATIDNDIGGTEATIGFDTAVNTAVEAINRIRDTASAHDRTFIVEVMGRHSGFIALAAALAGGAESVLIPEEEPDYDEICRRIQRGYQRGKAHSIIVVAEGAADGFQAAREIERRTGLETRVTVLGHVQRGGTPTAADRILASRLGAAAVDLLVAGRHGLMVGIAAGEVRPVPLATALAETPHPDGALIRLASILGL